MASGASTNPQSKYHVENEDGEWGLNKPAVEKSKGKRKVAGQPAGAKKAPKKKKVAKGRSLHSLCPEEAGDQIGDQDDDELDEVRAQRARESYSQP